MNLKHNQLQYLCHQYLWNEHPKLRYLSHANFNTLSTQGKNPIMTMAKLKSIGLVKGTFDYQFYYKGVLHVFDFKVGKDKLSNHQKNFQMAIELQGGKGYEVRSLKEFQEIIKNIIT